tara:strand:- start:1430 stop:3316 length:1887 start_codon:yes stop_codon:yes gene_type:complete
MGITDEINELEASLGSVDKLLVQSNKDALMLKSSLSGVNAFVSGKNYEIISRFLSGTGAWKVLNKAKATVLTMIQLVSVQERASLQDNLRMKKMAEIIRERKELIALESKFKEAALSKDRRLIEQLKEKSDVFAATAMTVGEDEALANILKRLDKTKTNLDKILGGSAKRQVMSLADIERRKQHRELLTDGKTNSLLIAAGLGTNLHQLLKIAKNTDAATAFQQETAKYEQLIQQEIEKGQRTLGGEDFTREQAKAALAKQDIFEPKASEKDIGRIQKFLDALKEASSTTKIKGTFGNLDNFTLERIGQSEDLGRDFRQALNQVFEVPFKEISDTFLPKLVGYTSFRKKFAKFHTKALKTTIKGFQRLGFFLKKFMYYFTVLTIVGFILYRAFLDLKPVLQKGFEGMMLGLKIAFEFLKIGFETLMVGLGDIREGFITGDFFKVLGGLFQVFMGGLIIFIGLIVGVLGSIYGFLIGAMMQFLTELTAGGKRTEKAITGALYLLGAILIGVGLFVTGTWIPVFAGVILAGIAALISKISPFSAGGVTGSGLQLVGEKGPELVKLPRGSRVYSNKDSGRMLSGGGTTNNITIQVTGRVGASDSEIKDIANKLSREMNNRMNRTGSAVSGF